MGISEHLILCMQNLFTDQEVHNVQNREKQAAFRLTKVCHKAAFPPGIYGECIWREGGLEEEEVGFKTEGTNFNHLYYADVITLLAK